MIYFNNSTFQDIKHDDVLLDIIKLLNLKKNAGIDVMRDYLCTEPVHVNFRYFYLQLFYYSAFKNDCMFSSKDSLQ